MIKVFLNITDNRLVYTQKKTLGKIISMVMVVISEGYRYLVSLFHASAMVEVKKRHEIQQEMKSAGGRS